jgi:hypothetical protein
MASNKGAAMFDYFIKKLVPGLHMVASSSMQGKRQLGRQAYRISNYHFLTATAAQPLKGPADEIQ